MATAVDRFRHKVRWYRQGLSRCYPCGSFFSSRRRHTRLQGDWSSDVCSSDLVRPGYVYGPGNEGITGRVGIGTFGVFLHLGGSNRVPFTYVDNCADAIALAGLKQGVDGEVFNVVDDNLPSSRQFLRLYKRSVERFRSIYVPHALSYGLCYLWELYSKWSEGQLEPTFNRRIWHSYWKKSRYSNAKIKMRLGWMQKVATQDGFRRYFEACRRRVQSA